MGSQLVHHLQRRTGRIEDRRNWKRWNCSICNPICNLRSMPNRLLMKSLAKPDPSWKLHGCKINFGFQKKKFKKKNLKKKLKKKKIKKNIWKIMNFFLPLTCSLYLWLFFREIREYKSRVESYSREMLRKEAQCRDLQQRLENGEGSKCINVINANSLMRIEIALIQKQKMITIFILR